MTNEEQVDLVYKILLKDGTVSTRMTGVHVAEAVAELIEEGFYVRYYPIDVAYYLITPRVDEEELAALQMAAYDGRLAEQACSQRTRQAA